MKAIETIKQTGQASVEQTCNGFNMHRDAYYKSKRRESHRKTIEAQVIKMVKEERKQQPRVGTRKLHEALFDEFKHADIKIGRDVLFNVLRAHSMLVKRKKASCKTTDSYHRFHTYNNLIKDMEVTAPNQVWVSDITYIRTIKGFCYLALITDM